MSPAWHSSAPVVGVALPHVLLAAGVALILAGCGGAWGLAGASWDSAGDLAEVDSYKAHIATGLTAIVQDNPCGSAVDDTFGVEQRFEDVFSDFPFSIERLEAAPVELPGTAITVAFRDRTFVATDNGRPLISETLPAVFSMRPSALGVGQLAGRPVILLVNRSRATTGRVFVAVYALEDGTTLYRDALSSGQVWDIQPSAGDIAVIGCGETRRITAQH
jgi:hypothetical protein